MGKFVNKLRKTLSFVPKKALVAFGIATAVAVPLAVGAWGPDRPTFTDQDAADYVTFNSIVSSEGYGDERDFVNIKEKTASVQNWSNELKVEPGKTYTVRMFVHNNAKPDLGLVAENVRATAAIDTAEAKTVNYVTGYINSSNATPTQYHDDVKFVSDTPFNLAYVPGSATYYNNVFNYTPLSDSLFGSNGVLLGYDKLDGKIPGCYQYSGYVFFDITPQFAQTFDFDVSKQVSAHGAKTWGETYKAQPGELVDFRIDYTNVTGERQDNVTLRDKMPEGLTVQNVRWYNLNTGAWQDAVNDITSTGINIGSYVNAGTKTRAELTVKVPEEDALECGINTFKNIGSVHVNDYRKDDDATVIVEKNCTEPEKEFTCDRLNINPKTRTEFEFTTDYTVKNTTYKNISYAVTGNGVNDTKVSTATDGKLAYSQLKAGTYKVVATLNTAAGSNTSGNCQGEITVEEEPEPSEAICKVLNANPLAIKTGSAVNFEVVPEYKGNVQVVGSYIDFGDGVKTNVNNVYNYSHIYANKGDYKAKAYINFIVDGEAKNGVTSVECEETVKVTETPPEYCEVPGKEHLPKDDPNCKEDEEEWCEVPGKEHLRPDDPDCKSDVVVDDPSGPTYLPKTGLEAFGILGLGSMTTAGAYYVASRRALKK